MKSWLTPTRLTGIGALLLLDIALNFLLLREALFTWEVLVPLLGGAALGLVWAVLMLVRLATGEAAAGTGRGVNTVVASVLFFGICAALFAFANRLDVAWDLTREGRRELAPQTRQVLEALDRDVTVYGLFVQAPGSESAVSARKTHRFLERCQRYTPYLEVVFHDPEKEPMILQQLDLKRPGLQGTVVVESGETRRPIQVSDVTGRLEERDFTNALVNVMRDTNPKVYFLTGHGEVALDDSDPQSGATALREWLVREGYQPAPLRFSPMRPEVPNDCDVLVMNGWKQPLAPAEVEALDAYMARGGRMLLLTDWWFIERQPGQQTVEYMRPWLLETFGIELGEDMVWSEERRYEVYLVPDFSLLGQQPAGAQLGSFNREHYITRGLDQNMVLTQVRTAGMSPRPPEGVVGAELLFSPPDTWAEDDLIRLRETLEADWETGEKRGPLPIATAAVKRTDTPVGDTEQTRDARIVVVGDRDMASNERIQVLGHVNFLMNTFAWLTQREDLIAIRPTGEEDPPIVLTPGQEQWVAWVASLGVLHVVLLAGLAMYAWRSRYQ